MDGERKVQECSKGGYKVEKQEKKGTESQNALDWKGP